MKNFSKIFARRQGRGRRADKDPSLLRSYSSSDFHQLSSRRQVSEDGDFVVTGKRAPRPGTLSRIIADGSDRVVSETEGEGDGNGDGDGDGAASSSVQVCETCAAIDFPRLLNWRPGEPRPWVSLSHTLADSDCPFCIFFQAMVGVQPDDETAKFTPYLRIRQAFERLGGLNEKHSLSREVLIEVTTKNKSLPWGYIVKAAEDETSLEGYLAEQPAIQGRTVTPLLDPALPKTWIQFCDDAHADTACGKSTVALEGLRLIDCQERRVVSVDDLDDRDGLKYVTLSYVNGVSREGDPTSNSDLPKDVPRVVEDAISFTIALGFRYLWVDRYCFASLEPAQRRRQLDFMGDIYSQSSLTFIVAAGVSADDGIPGISTPREEQLSLKTEHGVYTTSLLRPDIEVGRSKWASRGWTFQEGLLSRRRLVFTTSQAYFQCQCLHCHESMSLPLKLAPSINMGRVFPETGTMSGAGQIKRDIRAYIPKVFADNEDRLDAFRGVLRRYAQLGSAVDSFIGLPLFHPNDFHNEKVVSQTDRLAVALGWMPDGNVTSRDYADPYLFEGPFPSWTWLAWKFKPGQGTFKHSFNFNFVEDSSPLLTGVSAAPKMEISVGFEDELVVSWEIDGEAITKRTERITFLRLETFCFELTLRKKDESTELVQSSLSETSKNQVEAWFRSSKPPEGSETVPDGDYDLLGVLISGRSWTAGDAPGAATVLVCGRQGWKPEGRLVRLGALAITYDTFALVDDKNAVIRGIETDDVKVQKREIDLY